LIEREKNMAMEETQIERKEKKNGMWGYVNCEL
jgi:hypothetical protein